MPRSPAPPRAWWPIIKRGLWSLFALLLILWIAQLELCFTPQVRAAMTAAAACREIAKWRWEHRETPTPSTIDLASWRSDPLPETVKSLDYWHRPFLYLHDDDCFVLVSYGSDGKPDANQTYDLSLCRETTKRSTCGWPTKDTVFVNGEPLRYCLK